MEQELKNSTTDDFRNVYICLYVKGGHGAQVTPAGQSNSAFLEIEYEIVSSDKVTSIPKRRKGKRS
jgi:hypothetical protein